MYSIAEIFKIGPGPSSSHTFGPMKACEYMNEHYEADFFEVTLYGSLALTGKGHLTDYIIEKTLKVPCQIHFDLKTSCKHPNTMKIVAYQQKKN